MEINLETMEATYELRVEELTPEWLEDFKKKFGKDRKVIIKAEPAETEPRKSQYEIFLEMEEIRKSIKLTPADFPPDFDINDIIDEVNDVEL